MAELPHMPMFWGDYFGDTTHLTCLEHGAYLQLIGKYWRQGHGLPDDDARLARLVGLSKKEWLSIREIVSEFFAISGGVWLHNRIEQELAEGRTKIEQARSAALARWGNGSKHTNGKANGMRTHGKRMTERNADAYADAMPSRTRTNNNPLTPLERGALDAPGPKSGRASTASEAKPIGDVLGRIGSKLKK